MLVLPFEHARLLGLAEAQYTDVYLSELNFWQYHLRNIFAALDATKPIRAQIDELEVQVQHLASLMPSPEIHQRLLALLQYTVHLIDSVTELVAALAQTRDFKVGLKQLLTKCELINQLLVKGQDLYHACFNNIVEPLMTSSLFLVVSSRAYLHELIKAEVGDELVDRLVGLESAESYEQETALHCKASGSAKNASPERQILYEQ